MSEGPCARFPPRSGSGKTPEIIQRGRVRCVGLRFFPQLDVCEVLGDRVPQRVLRFLVMGPNHFDTLVTAASSASLRRRLALAWAGSLPTEMRLRFAPTRPFHVVRTLGVLTKHAEVI